MNGIYLYFVNKHLPSWALLRLKSYLELPDEERERLRDLLEPEENDDDLEPLEYELKKKNRTKYCYRIQDRQE